MRLFHQSKFLFVLVILFFVLHINANFFFGGQQSPFFHWNLYAAPVVPRDSFSFWEVQYNGDQVLKIPHTWQQPGSMLIVNPLMRYMYMYENGYGASDQYILNWNLKHPSIGKLFPGLKFFPDTAEMKVFPDWFANKLEQYVDQPIHQITIFKISVKFNDDGTVRLLSRTPVCKLK